MSKWQIVTPTPVPLREVWPHEKHDFSRWVKSNVPFLNQHLGITIDEDTFHTEVAVENFSADLVGQAVDDTTGDQVTVVVENQLARTDHDHLGKVITYAAHHQATYAVWIAAEVQQAHVRAVQWLNDHSDLTVWLFTVEAVQTAPGHAAPLLRRIVGPSALATAARATSKANEADVEGRRLFFEEVIGRASVEFASERMFQYGAPTGASVHVDHNVPGAGYIVFQFWVTSRGSWLCLRVDHPDGADAAAAAYAQLTAHRPTIEAAFGDGLQWIEAEGTRSRQIRWDNPVVAGFRDDPDLFPGAADSLVAGMRRLHDAVAPHLPTAVDAWQQAAANVAE